MQHAWFTVITWPWTTKPVLGYICSNGQKYILWVNIIDFSMKILCTFPTVNISKLNFWIVICIAKDFIWTTLKAIFSILRFFLHPQILDFQIVVYLPNIVLSQQIIHQWKACLFSFQMMKISQFQKVDLYDWFCGLGSHMICRSMSHSVFGREWSAPDIMQ